MFKQNTHATKFAREYPLLQQMWSIYTMIEENLFLNAAAVFLAGFQSESDPPWPTAVAFSSHPLNIPYKQAV